MLKTENCTVLINGKARAWTPGFTVGDALGALINDSAAIVVEVNGVILPREDLTLVPLAAGDVVEIVHFVGGG